MANQYRRTWLGGKIYLGLNGCVYKWHIEIYRFSIAWEKKH